MLLYHLELGPETALVYYYIIIHYTLLCINFFEFFSTGQKFALLEAKTVLSTLFRRFHFTYDMNKHGPIKPGFEVIKEGIPLIITPITKH